MKFKERKSEGSGEGVKNLIKLKDGESVIGVLKGDPYEFYQSWPKGGEKKSSTEWFEGSSFRFQINMIVKEGTTYTAKVLEQGSRLYNALKDLNNDYPLEETAIKITRTGEGTEDTRYAVIPLPPKMQPNAQTWKVINQVTLNDLGPTKPMPAKGHDPSFEDASWAHESESPDPHDELPF